jgi:hypothetical protein
MPDRTRYATWIAFVLIAIGAWRVLAVVSATPLLGYANQFDMRRISACVGLWPDVPPAARLEAHPEAPFTRYVRGERRPDECYWSSELLFVAPVAATMHVDQTIDLRVIGAIKAGALILVALSIGAALRRRPGPALIHGVVFAVVVCDPVVTLWLDTLYTEFAAVLFAYVSVGALVAVATRESPSERISPLQMAALAVGLIGLGLSRQQHMFLPALFVLPLVISLWEPDLRSAVSLLVLAGAIAFAQAELIDRHPTIAQANSADVVLGAILPASRNEALTAERLGLPARCLRSVGATWYDQMGEALEETCPEALAMPKARLAVLIATEPRTLLRAAFRGLPQLQDWRLGYLGSVAGMRYAGSGDVQAAAGVVATSAGPIVAGMPTLVFLPALAASAVIFALSAGVCVVALLSRRSAALALTLYSLTGIAWYAIVTSIFGDGYVEVARHAHLAAVALFATVVVLASTLLVPLLPLFGPAPPRSITAAGFAVVAIGTAWLAQWPLRDAMDAVPMAFGVVDRPVQNRNPPGDVEFSGWAVDPRSVARVELVIDGAPVPARYGVAYRGARDEPLSLYFPAYPNTADAGFVAVVPAGALRRGSAEVRTVVVNAAGIRTEIDRRLIIDRDR